MEEKRLKIELTGNPFVDTGLGVIGALANIDDIKALTFVDIKSVYGDGTQITEWNSKLKAFTQIFGTNNPLKQPSYPSRVRGPIYKSTLSSFLKEINQSTEKGPKCWACGSPSNFDFGKVCKKAVEDNGQKPPEDKHVGRDWFPLAGSLGSDAQALPAASKAPHICPKCIFAIHYLPIGLILLNGRLAVFQCSSTEFWHELLHDIVNEIKGRILSGNYETIGSKEGSRAVMGRLLALFQRLQKEAYYGEVPEGTALYAWRFSNSGSSPECEIQEIPNPALVFLWDAVREGLRSDIELLVKSEGKNPRYSLFQCILDKRDYPNLYPEGKRKGAVPKLFALYQTCIRNHSSRALQLAYKLAKEISQQLTAKELKRIQRTEAFREEKVRNQFRSSMVRLAETGELALADYLDLFPVKESAGITVEWEGWNFIRFYLHHPSENDKPIGTTPSKVGFTQNPSLYYAGVIYNHYVKERGRQRFQRDVLGQLKLGRLGLKWLRDQFIQFAESEVGFTYGHWLKLCKLDNGRTFVSELLFQMRLLWSQWFYENRTSVGISVLTDGKSSDGLTESIDTLIKELFTSYVEGRGLDRFHRDILLRLRRREIGLFWFKEKITKQIYEDVQSLTEQQWEDFLVDDEGQGMKSERLFQLHLALANLYRVKGFNEKQRR